MTKSNGTAFSFTKSTTYSSKTKNSSETSSPKVQITSNSKTKDWEKKSKKENASATSPNTWSTSSPNSKDKTPGSGKTPPVSTKNLTPSTDRNHVTFLNILIQIPRLHLLIFIHKINDSLSQLDAFEKINDFLSQLRCLLTNIKSKIMKMNLRFWGQDGSLNCFLLKFVLGHTDVYLSGKLRYPFAYPFY